uniref:DNA-directed DNA polymerase n=1 Tax=Pithovirus LCPAC104 TaxID=2506589 RepID=A0A481Z4U2_9VIRU|nr:MAG: DNA polymerase family X [Pithovirus LCPAC104]
MDIRKCIKSSSQGGLSRKEINEYAEKIGINFNNFRKKDDLCDEIIRIEKIKELEVIKEIKNNELIIKTLNKLSSFYKKSGDKFRSIAFSKAENLISKLNFNIEFIEQIKNIPNIGEGILKRIDEILKTGKLKELEQFGEDFDFTTILGFGPTHQRNLIDIGVKNIEDLKDAISKKKFIPTILQNAGIKYLEDFKIKIPRSEIFDIGGLIIKEAKKINPFIIIEIVGSYRRKKENSRDIDILISHKENVNILEELINNLMNIELIKEKLSLGKIKFMGIYFSNYMNKDLKPIARKIDIRFIPYESYHSALLHSTGPVDFNIKIRNIAITKNLSLSEFGLLDKKSNIKYFIESEKNIFDILELTYLSPKDRENVIILK